MIKTDFCLFPWEINCSKTLGNWEGGRLFSSRCCLGVAALCLLPDFPSSLLNILDRRGVGCSPRWPTLLADKWHHEDQRVLSSSYEPPASRGPDTLLQALQCWIPGQPHRKGLLLMTNRPWTVSRLRPHPSTIISASVEPTNRSSGRPRDPPSRTLVCRLTAGYSQVGSGNLGKWEGPLKTARGPWAAIPRVSLEGCDDCLLLPAPELAPICLKQRMFREKAVLSCQWQSFIFFGKTGSGAYLSLSCCLVDKSYPTLCDPMNFSLSGSSIHGIFHARKLQWVAMSFSKESSRPTDQEVLAGRFYTTEPTWKAVAWVQGWSNHTTTLPQPPGKLRVKRKITFFCFPNPYCNSGMPGWGPKLETRQ